MTYNSQVIPKELLTFRLSKQLHRLRQIFSSSTSTENEAISSKNEETEEIEDKFQLYQRVLSWFIMGRLAKTEYDAILQNLLATNESIEIHNKVIELLRAIYCDSGSCNNGSSSMILSNFVIDGSNILDSFTFELGLLPAEEANFCENEVEIRAEIVEDSEDMVGSAPVSIPFLSNPKIKQFQTSIENLNLTSSEEALISEALKNPIHELVTNEGDFHFIDYRKSFDVFIGNNHRLCTEIASLPDQHVMKQRFLKIALNLKNPHTTATISDSIAALACKALEDYMRSVFENLSTLKYGHQPLLRPPLSYTFPDEYDPSEILNETDTKTETTITLNDLTLLFRLKPWLMAEMMETFFEKFLE